MERVVSKSWSQSSQSFDQPTDVPLATLTDKDVYVPHKSVFIPPHMGVRVSTPYRIDEVRTFEGQIDFISEALSSSSSSTTSSSSSSSTKKKGKKRRHRKRRTRTSDVHESRKHRDRAAQSDSVDGSRLTTSVQCDECKDKCSHCVVNRMGGDNRPGRNRHIASHDHATHHHARHRHASHRHAGYRHASRQSSHDHARNRHVSHRVESAGHRGVSVRTTSRVTAGMISGRHLSGFFDDASQGDYSSTLKNTRARPASMGRYHMAQGPGEHRYRARNYYHSVRALPAHSVNPFGDTTQFACYKGELSDDNSSSVVHIMNKKRSEFRSGRTHRREAQGMHKLDCRC